MVKFVLSVLMAVAALGAQVLTQDGAIRLQDSADLGRIELEPQVLLGTDEAGLLEETGGVDSIVRDSAGNYWVGGQRGQVKVFRPDGMFLRTVGRRGQGPLEFQYPEPFHLDQAGNVHVLDTGNSRISLISPSFDVADELSVPRPPNDISALADGERYVINSRSARSTSPLHVIDEGGVQRSLGEAPSGLPPAEMFLATSRIVASNGALIASARPYDYSLKIWDAAGEQLLALEGDPLNRQEVMAATFSEENPPPRTIHALRFLDESSLVVLIWEPRSNWREHMTERTQPDGTTALIPTSGSMGTVLTTRIELIDLDAHGVVARGTHDGVLLGFPSDDQVAAAVFDELGDLQIAILSVRYPTTS